MHKAETIVQEVLASTSSSQISNTPATRSKTRRFTDEEIDKTNMFFARLVTIYGRSKTKTIWGDSEEQLRTTRREWAREIGKLSIQQLEEVFTKLKNRLARNDRRFAWPDIPQILALATEPEAYAAHTVFKAALPEPDWRKEQRRRVALIASQTVQAYLAGRACLLEERPSHE